MPIQPLVLSLVASSRGWPYHLWWTHIHTQAGRHADRQAGRPGTHARTHAHTHTHTHTHTHQSTKIIYKPVGAQG